MPLSELRRVLRRCWVQQRLRFSKVLYDAGYYGGSLSKDIQAVKKATGMIDLVARTKGTYLAPKEVLKKIEVLAPEAVNTIEKLMLTSKADSVRLKAATVILELAGVTRETRLTITHDVKDMDSTEIDRRLQALMGTAAGVVLEGDFREVYQHEVHQHEVHQEEVHQEESEHNG